jgi:hypothetical protein
MITLEAMGFMAKRERSFVWSTYYRMTNTHTRSVGANGAFLPPKRAQRCRVEDRLALLLLNQLDW